MSTIAARARAEADEAEAAEEEETPEPEPEPEPTPEPTPEPEPEPEPQQRQVIPTNEAAVEKAINAYAKALPKALGDAFDALIPCPTCLAVGNLPGFVTELPDPGPQHREAKDKTTCPECDGWGDVLTGAKVDRGRLYSCLGCGGQGWVQKVQPQPTQAQGNFGANQVPAGYLPPAAEWQPVNDLWGRPLGHPHYGQDPAGIGV